MGCYNAPTACEVVLVIVGQQYLKSEILLGIQSHDNVQKCINALHRSYGALQCPVSTNVLVGRRRIENSNSIGIFQCDPKTKQSLGTTVSAASFYVYRIMIREGEDSHLSSCGVLFNQYLVDMYAKISEDTEIKLY